MKRQILNSTKFNQLQKQALQNAVTEKVSLISGLAGTGKTYALCSIAKLYNHNNNKVLMCAPNQASMNAICDHLDNQNIQHVRVYAKSLNDQLFTQDSSKISNNYRTNELHHIGVDRLIAKMELNDNIDFSESEIAMLKIIVNYGHEIDAQKIIQLFGQSQGDHFADKDERAVFKSIKEKYEKITQQILKETPIIVTSAFVCGDSRFSSIHFDVGLIDDCSRLNQYQTIVPIMKCSKRLVLASDQNQHRVRTRLAELMTKNFGFSLFDNLVELKSAKHVILREQMRCHPKLCLLDTFSYQKEVQHFTEAGNFINLRKFPCALYSVRKDDFYDPKQHQLESVLTELIGLYRVKDIAIIIPQQEEKETIERLITDINIKLKPDRVSIQILTPNEITGKEFDAVVLSLFSGKRQSHKYRKNLLETVLTRHKRVLVAFGNHVNRPIHDFFKDNNASIDWRKDLDEESEQ